MMNLEPLGKHGLFDLDLVYFVFRTEKSSDRSQAVAMLPTVNSLWRPLQDAPHEKPAAQNQAYLLRTPRLIPVNSGPYLSRCVWEDQQVGSSDGRRSPKLVPHLVGSLTVIGPSSAVACQEQ